MTPRDLTESLPEIGRRIDEARSLFLGLDFDGTLAPIGPRPDDVILADPVRERLHRLSRLPGVTPMVVSGRGLADVSARVGLPGLIYAGNHGLEIRGPGIEFVVPAATAFEGPLRELAGRLEAALEEVPGALLESKGLTASVHDRNVPDSRRGEVERRVRQAVATDPDRFHLTSGRRVWEIRPRLEWNKGKAVSWVLERLPGPRPRLDVFIGDDRTDEDAFAVMPDGITVKVGPARPTLARYTVPDPAGVEGFLGWLLAEVARNDRLNESR